MAMSFLFKKVTAQSEGSDESYQGTDHEGEDEEVCLVHVILAIMYFGMFLGGLQ